MTGLRRWHPLLTSASLALFANVGVVAGTDPQGEDAACRPYFANACSAALGHWLPGNRVGYPPQSDSKSATNLRVRDYLIYEGQEVLPGDGPRHGTFFVYARAGPPRGRVIYDHVHRVALYAQGCCAWGSVVAAANVGPPPKAASDRDLSTLHTARGIRLGDTPAHVMATLGSATLREKAGSREVGTLLYTRAIRGAKSTYTCKENESLHFIREGLSVIEFYDAC